MLSLGFKTILYIFDISYLHIYYTYSSSFRNTKIFNKKNRKDIISYETELEGGEWIKKAIKTKTKALFILFCLGLKLLQAFVLITSHHAL